MSQLLERLRTFLLLVLSTQKRKTPLELLKTRIQTAKPCQIRNFKTTLVCLNHLRRKPIFKITLRSLRRLGNKINLQRSLRKNSRFIILRSLCKTKIRILTRLMDSMSWYRVKLNLRSLDKSQLI